MSYNHWDNPEPHIYFEKDFNSYFALRWVAVGPLSVDELGHVHRSVRSFASKEDAEASLFITQ